MKNIHKQDDFYLWLMKQVIHYCLKALAALMILVIISGVVDVGWMLYQRLHDKPHFILTINDILATFGAFLVVLIAIEIFQNIILYLRDDIIHVKIVLATALMAVARKVIILDYENLESHYVYATGLLLIATGAAYYLIHKLPEKTQSEN